MKQIVHNVTEFVNVEPMYTFELSKFNEPFFQCSVTIYHMNNM